MNITDLKTSITNMSHEQALNLVLERRDSRLTPKKRSSNKSKKHEPMTLDEIIELSSPKQAQELLKKMQERMKDGD